MYTFVYTEQPIMKSSYNERFSFADPLSKTAACRSTRHRAKKLKEDTSSLFQHSAEAIPNIPDCGDESEEEVMLESQNIVTSLPNDSSLDPYRGTSFDITNDEFQLTTTSHPQSLEFLELMAIVPEPELELEEDDTNDGEAINSSANSEPSINESGAHAEILYKDSLITTAASNVVIMKYAMKHNLTMEALADLLQVVKLHCPSPNNIPSTLFHFKKRFQDLQYPVQYHFYCNACLTEVPENCEVCSNQDCCYNFAEAKSLSSFIELPVGLQLKSILSRKLSFAYMFG